MSNQGKETPAYSVNPLKVPPRTSIPMSGYKQSPLQLQTPLPEQNRLPSNFQRSPMTMAQQPRSIPQLSSNIHHGNGGITMGQSGGSQLINIKTEQGFREKQPNVPLNISSLQFSQQKTLNQLPKEYTPSQLSLLTQQASFPHRSQNQSQSKIQQVPAWYQQQQQQQQQSAQNQYFQQQQQQQQQQLLLLSQQPYLQHQQLQQQSSLYFQHQQQQQQQQQHQQQHHQHQHQQQQYQPK